MSPKTPRLHDWADPFVALALYPLVILIYFASDVWLWIGSQWRKRWL